MRANTRRNTGPEREVRRRLHALRLRYRVDYPIQDGLPRPVRPDIVFTRSRVAVFVDGCFWHGCPEHGQRPSGANRHYWAPKIARNVERDHEQVARLVAAGWTVVRAWEHEDPEEVAVRVSALVRATKQAAKSPDR